MARILVVEDDDSVRQFTARALTIDGHDVMTAADGDLGLDVLQEESGEFDLVLSDIRMPSLDGIAFAKQASSAFPGLPIMLMTGYAEQRERAADLADIIIDVVNKPFTLAEIRSSVARSLQSAQAA